MPEQWTTTRFSHSLGGRVSHDTVPEKLLRSALHKAGVRFRIHRRIGTRLSVDIIMPSHRIAVFVDGCFWHNHGCNKGGGKIPSGPNADAWAAKFAMVKERESRAKALLERSGFSVLRIWECAVKADPKKAANTVIRFIEGQSAMLSALDRRAKAKCSR